VVGDLVFLAEGGLVTRRLRWPEADRLRLPFRALAHLPGDAGLVEEGVALIRVQAALIDECRAAFLPTKS
jgi:hypothetical protein